ncbi:SGNH/GDSL hydrolase family protein [Aureimonas flava]|uniref:SGNH/GDSL hydrolase family protein n=1 Tax=Aureimonas flava TaxID=2320271 RepID=A0A3A1WM15_9HYPH|nr:SGNH/GDSL hydrolase family protein [Aureimonas flava]RIY02597.1 SGNH/GDSL hydrolase family protein [Aureimonas flava]
MGARGARPSLAIAALAAGIAAAAPARGAPGTGDGPLRVATFGTSLTANGGWQTPLAEAMEACAGRPVTVSNHGRAGAASDWGVEAVGDVAAERPDIVFLEFAVNDAALDRMIGVSASVENMRAIVGALRRARSDVLVYVMAMNPLSGRRLWARPFRARYEDAHRRLAQDLGLRYIDHRPDWEAMGRPALYLAIVDGAHPTAGAASAIVVPNIMRRLAEDGVLACAPAARP